MAKGLVGGMTDYSHQSFNDIISDLESEKENTIAFIKMIEEGIEKANENKYWDNKVPYDFKSIVAYSLKHYRTTVTELCEIVEEIKNEVQEHHFRRLQRISKVANEINSEIGQVWNRKYDDKIKDYGEKKFLQVEQVYSDTRDMAVNFPMARICNPCLI
jgi:excinuclease UvrABC helicase subunit UvrB